MAPGPDPSLRQQLRLVWQVIREAPSFAATLMLAALASLTEGFGVMLLVPVLAAIGGGTGGNSGFFMPWLTRVPLWGLLIGILVLVALRVVLQRAAAIARARMVNASVDAVRHDIHASLFAAEWRWLAVQRRADFLDILVSKTGWIGEGLNHSISALVLVLNIIIYAVVALLLSWQTALVALVCGAIILFLAHGQSSAALHFGHHIGPLHRDVNRAVQESVMAIRTSKVIGLEKMEVARLGQAVAALRAAQMNQLAFSTKNAGLVHVAAAALVAALVWFGVDVAGLSLALLLPLLVVFARLLPMLQSAHQSWLLCLHAVPAIRLARDMQAALDRAAEPAGLPDADPLDVRDSITLENVSVRFDGRDAAALHDISLTIPARTTSLLTGPSGAGKSSLADVLAGLIEPDAGRLTIDGVAVAGAARQRLRQSVCYVDQQTTLLTGTVRSNLVAVRPLADDDRLRAALTVASADFVWDLPNGIDTEVGDNGVQLSGGERQRIALARAMLCDPSILVLDEATNALDAENRDAIAASLAKLRGALTIVIISHGDMPVAKVDQIFTLNKGRLVQPSE